MPTQLWTCQVGQAGRSLSSAAARACTRLLVLIPPYKLPEGRDDASTSDVNRLDCSLQSSARHAAGAASWPAAQRHGLVGGLQSPSAWAVCKVPTAVLRVDLNRASMWCTPGSEEGEEAGHRLQQGDQVGGQHPAVGAAGIGHQRQLQAYRHLKQLAGVGLVVVG